MRCRESYYHYVRTSGSVIVDVLIPVVSPGLVFGGCRLADHAIAGTGTLGALLVLGLLYLGSVLRRRRLYARFCRIMREGGTIEDPDAGREAREVALLAYDRRGDERRLDAAVAARGEAEPP